MTPAPFIEFVIVMASTPSKAGEFHPSLKPFFHPSPWPANYAMQATTMDDPHILIHHLHFVLSLESRRAST